MTPLLFSGHTARTGGPPLHPSEDFFSSTEAGDAPRIDVARLRGASRMILF